MGACIIATLQLSAAWRWTRRCRFVVFAFTLVLVSVFVSRCWSRNADWRNAVTLYRSGVSVNPRNEKLHDLLATRLHNSGRGHVEARFHAEKAIDINPSYWHAHATVGQMHAANNDIPSALFSYNRALELAEAQGLSEFADVPKIRLNLAMLLQAKAPAEAELHFNEVVKSRGIGGFESTASVVFGAFLESLGPRNKPGARLQEAAHRYRMALASSETAASDGAVHIRLGTVLIKELRHAESEHVQTTQNAIKDVRRPWRAGKEVELNGGRSIPRENINRFSWPNPSQCSTLYRHDTQQSEPSPNGNRIAHLFAHQRIVPRCHDFGTPHAVDGDSVAGIQLELIQLVGSSGGSGDWCSTSSGFEMWIAFATRWLDNAIRSSAVALTRVREVVLHGGMTFLSWISPRVQRSVAVLAGQTQRPASAADAVAEFQFAPSPEVALRHLRRGLSLDPTSESATLDPGGKRRAQAFALVAARLAGTGRMKEASEYLRRIHTKPAVALRILGARRLEEGDVAAAYEALVVSAKLKESVKTLFALADALDQAGDVMAAEHYRKRAALLGIEKKSDARKRRLKT
eukprot:TRINITY_DN38564_c0_g2_i1.p1 TRINITY_DN38564_c0_g2~~TRINITY_DN38564_c0_g2_i1.p1  ORF type:complete len:606 (-),score=66.64 TRINITY_DN38564_c0_g2_i1:8-1732(-)